VPSPNRTGTLTCLVTPFSIYCFALNNLLLRTDETVFVPFAKVTG